MDNFYEVLAKSVDNGSLNVPQQISKKFHSENADVTFVSSDNVLFSTLELLFQYIHPMHHPELEDTPFEILAPLAEAAEKYEVFSAMVVCKIRMKQALPEHAVGVFDYASRHGYKEVLGRAAPFLLDIATYDLVKTLAPELVVPWIRYRETWSRAAFKVITESVQSNNSTIVCARRDGDYPKCKGGNIGCRQVYDKMIFSHLWVSLGEKRSLNALAQLYETPIDGSCAHLVFEDRRKRLEAALKDVPCFDKFL